MVCCITVEWYAASIGHSDVGWNAPAITDGMTAALFTQDVTFRSNANITVNELRVATGQLVSLYRNLNSLQLVYATSSTATPQAVEVLGNESYKVLLQGCGGAELQAFGKCTVTLNTGGWFGAVSPQTSATRSPARGSTLRLTRCASWTSTCRRVASGAASGSASSGPCCRHARCPLRLP